MSLHYIVDGYNIIKHDAFSPNLKTRLDSKSGLLSFIRNNQLTGSQKNTLKIVFDGYPDTYWQGNKEKDEVVFSGDISADEKIIKLLEKNSRPKDVIVVSDDRELRFLARSLGAKVLAVEDFICLKEKTPKRKNEEAETELTFSQKHDINEELRKLWLK